MRGNCERWGEVGQAKLGKWGSGRKVVAGGELGLVGGGEVVVMGLGEGEIGTPSCRRAAPILTNF